MCIAPSASLSLFLCQVVCVCLKQEWSLSLWHSSAWRQRCVAAVVCVPMAGIVCCCATDCRVPRVFLCAAAAGAGGVLVVFWWWAMEPLGVCVAMLAWLAFVCVVCCVLATQHVVQTWHCVCGRCSACCCC